MSLRRRLAEWKPIHWILAGAVLVTVLALAAGAILVWAVAESFDTDKDLSDFASPAESRAFVSAHLPLALPADATVIELRYEHFTDWILTARVRLASERAAQDYLDGVRIARKTNDAYCGAEEPIAGARYFLSDVSACGSVMNTAGTLSVRCNTR